MKQYLPGICDNCGKYTLIIAGLYCESCEQSIRDVIIEERFVDLIKEVNKK